MAEGPRVLVVEDEYMVALFTEDYLKKVGAASVTIVRDVESGVAALGKETFDLALLDIHLDDDLSFAVADRLAEAGVPFAFITGQDSNKIPKRFADRPVLTKPATLPTLQQTFRKLIDARPDAAKAPQTG